MPGEPALPLRARLLQWLRRLRVIEFATMAVLFIVAQIVGSFAKPFCRSFEWTDATIDHEFIVNDTFPDYSLALFVACGAVFLVVCELVVRLRGDHSPERYTVAWVLAFFTAQFFQFLLSTRRRSTRGICVQIFFRGCSAPATTRR